MTKFQDFSRLKNLSPFFQVFQKLWEPCTPSTATSGRMTTKQVNPVQVHQETPCQALLEDCMHVHQPVSQVCKPGESLALQKVKHPLNGRTSVSRLPLTKQDILSQYSSCFEGIGCFPGDPYKFHLKPEHKPA